MSGFISFSVNISEIRGLFYQYGHLRLSVCICVICV